MPDSARQHPPEHRYAYADVDSLALAVTAGGTDYGGCVGRYIFCAGGNNRAAANAKVQYPQTGFWGVPTDAENTIPQTNALFPAPTLRRTSFYNSDANSWGIFGKINSAQPSPRFAMARRTPS